MSWAESELRQGAQGPLQNLHNMNRLPPAAVLDLLAAGGSVGYQRGARQGIAHGGQQRCFGLRIFRREIRHRQIIKEDNRSFGVFYVSQKI